MTAKLIYELSAECIENLRKQYNLNTIERVKEFLINVWKDYIPFLYRSSDKVKAVVEVDDRQTKKAYIANVRYGHCCDIVFAETRGKAKKLAWGTGACEDADFIDIEVRRLPKLDKYYKEGKNRMDWENPDDRLILVRECGFYCEYVDIDECAKCCAKDYCDEYESFIDAHGENDE